MCTSTNPTSVLRDQGGSLPPRRPALQPRRTAIAIVACVSTGLLIYSNSFSGKFLFDDWTQILASDQVRQMRPPVELVLASARPVATLTLSLNYALHGEHLWGYHLVNLAIHLAATLVLFGTVRRSLSGGRLAARFSEASCGLALAVALVWMAHPLQTQSVTYIVQRTESLMGLFYLVTLYAFIRAQDSARPGWWYALSVASCAFGMATKEVMATAPVMVLWYDRALIGSSWRQIARQRGVYYLALASTWGILAGLMLAHTDRYVAAGTLVVRGVTPLQYALTQPSVILHYLRLAFWPSGQCLDYSWPPATSAVQIVPAALATLALLGGTMWCMFRYPACGFLGGWFFVILAPTSSVLPIRDLAFEHRMYLPLASVAAGVVIGAYWGLERFLGWYRVGRIGRRGVEIAAAGLVITALGGATYLRNEVYASEVTMWQDVVEKAPYNPRGYNNLGFALMRQGRYDEADRCLHEALRLFPPYLHAQVNLGLLRMMQGNVNEAVACFRRAVQRHPDSAWAQIHLAHGLARQNNTAEASRHLREALRLNPRYLEEVQANEYLRPLLSDPATAPGGLSLRQSAPLKTAPLDR